MSPVSILGFILPGSEQTRTTLNAPTEIVWCARQLPSVWLFVSGSISCGVSGSGDLHSVPFHCVHVCLDGRLDSGQRGHA